MPNVRSISINTNFQLLKKIVKENNLTDVYDDDFLEIAAVWNYNQFGFGYVSLDKYLDFLKSKRIKVK